MAGKETPEKLLSKKDAALLRRVVLEKYAKRAVLLRALHQYNKLQEQGFPTQAPSNPFGSKNGDDNDDDDWSITSHEDDDDNVNSNELWYVKTENRVITIYCERRQYCADAALNDKTISAPELATPSEKEKEEDDDNVIISSNSPAETQTTKKSACAAPEPKAAKVIESATALIDKVLHEHDGHKGKLKHTVKKSREMSPQEATTSSSHNLLIQGADRTTRNQAIAATSSLEVSNTTKFQSTKDRIAFWDNLATRKETAGDTKNVQSGKTSTIKSVNQKVTSSKEKVGYVYKKKGERTKTK